MCAAAQTRPRLIALMGDNFGKNGWGTILAESLYSGEVVGDLAAFVCFSLARYVCYRTDSKTKPLYPLAQ